jgi:hypothetical protein
LRGDGLADLRGDAGRENYECENTVVHIALWHLGNPRIALFFGLRIHSNPVAVPRILEGVVGFDFFDALGRGGVLFVVGLAGQSKTFQTSDGIGSLGSRLGNGSG